MQPPRNAVPPSSSFLLDQRPSLSSNERIGGAAGFNIMTGSASQPHFDMGNNGVVMQEDDIINFVRSLQVDPLLTENVKSKIIAKVRLRDSGIMGAYQLYLVDGDAEGFKARIIHRALTPP
jgi:hypothetical protein